MSNDVLLVSVKAVRPDLVTQTDNVIYVPLASKNAHGIVKIGEGLNITQDGVLSLDSMPLENLKASLLEEILEVDDRLSVHITDYNNPHRVTKTQVGLSNVDNTSDLDKPISTAVQKEFTRVEGLIKGSSSAKTFTDYKALIAAVKQMPKTELIIGQNIYVSTKNVPDLWVYDVVDAFQEFEYTDDATIESLLVDGTLNVGYYKFAALETLKVNLDDYVTLSSRQTITGDKNFTGDLRLNGMDVATIDDVNSVTLDTLHFQPINGSIIYANDKVYYQGEFSYTTINDDTPVAIAGTIVLPIKGVGVDIHTDDTGEHLILEASTVGTTVTLDGVAQTEWSADDVLINPGKANSVKAIIIETSGNQGTRSISSTSGNCLVLRPTHGRLYTANPVNDTDAANKDYVDGLISNTVSLSEIQTITGIKTFTEQIGILNGGDGDINYIKHINNNFLVSSSDGENIINIDEQLKTFNFYNKPLALEEYVDTSIQSAIQNTWEASY